MTGNAFRAGLRGGFEWSNMYLKSIAHDYHGKSRPAFQVCLVGEYDIMETVALQTGLGYYELKTHATDPLSNDPVVLDIMMRGIQVPFLLQPHFSYGEMDIYGSFGMYVGWMISGKESMSGAGADTLYSSSVSFQSSSGQFIRKRMDVGILAGGGIEYNGFTIGVWYTSGLTNFSVAPDMAGTKNISLLVGYMIGEKDGRLRRRR